jgi:hypothetical protein
MEMNRRRRRKNRNGMGQRREEAIFRLDFLKGAKMNGREGVEGVR